MFEEEKSQIVPKQSFSIILGFQFLLFFSLISDNLPLAIKFLIPFIFDRLMDYRIEELVKKIEFDLNRTPPIEELARVMGMSVSRLQHLFKKETGTSITKYIKELRLQKAREFLETTHLSIKEIRGKVGIANEPHFLHDFKRRFGRTPSEYRKNFCK